jgi:hypothetical protein
MRIPPTTLAVLAAATLAGCFGTGSGSISRELTSAQFEDVPVPDGFAIDASEGRSFSYSEGGGGAAAIRLGRLEYTGRGDPAETLTWYAEEMPRSLHGWGQGVVREGDTPSMLFERGGERCVVTVRTEGGGIRIVVMRNVADAAPPAPEPAPEPEAEPAKDR